MAKTYRLQWDRTFREGSASQRIRYQRRGEPWCEVGSVDELPEDLRQALEHARGRHDSLTEDLSRTADDFVSAETFAVGRRRRRLRRRKIHAREIDRTLFLDHPWFNGFTLFCIAVAAPYMGYLAWGGIQEGGLTAWASGTMLALAAVLAYFGLCVLLNSTEFRIDDDRLTVRHGPLPWPGSRKIPVDRIVQISTRMHRSRHSLTFSLTASLAGGMPVRLAEGINTFAEAKSIERAIERHLRIEDWDE